MKEPVYTMATYVPGSKARFAMQRGYDKEICADLAARAFNNMVVHGVRPVLMSAQIVCGNKDYEQIWGMAEAYKKVCVSNGVIYSGIEVSAQPINYLPNQYELSIAVTGAADRSKLVTGERIKESDVVIGIMTEGLDSCCFPFVRVMLNKNPELEYAKIDENNYFMEEILKPNKVYVKAISELLNNDLLHGIIKIDTSISNDFCYRNVPEGLGVCINMESIPITPLYKFISELDLVGERFFPYRFAFGIGMEIIVAREKVKEAMDIIEQYHECHVIGRVEKNVKHTDEKVWLEGKIRWKNGK